MTQETVKERIYRGALETMSDSDFMSNKYVKKFVKGVFKQIEDVPATTDKLSVEKLQEYLLPYKKEMVQKIIDEKMQLVTADEFLKLHKESLTAIRENDKLQEQLNTAKKALTEIINANDNLFLNVDGRGDLDTALDNARDALAAIGGD